jgi:hypothetical protein
MQRRNKKRAERDDGDGADPKLARMPGIALYLQ